MAAMVVTLVVVGPVPIHGKAPGVPFELTVDAAGTVNDALWRRRLDDERLFASGVVRIVNGTTLPVVVPPDHTACPCDPIGGFDRGEINGIAGTTSNLSGLVVPVIGITGVDNGEM